jgi:hypothetical protein
MKKNPKFLTKILSYLSLCLVLSATGFAVPPTAADYIASGRASLANETPTDLLNADTAFANALALEPTNPTANFFRAATRLLLLQSQPAFQTLLTNLGAVTNNSNIYSLSSTSYAFNTDANGRWIPAANSSSDQIIAYVYNTLLPAVALSEANLANITDQGFSLQLSAAETSLMAVNIDYGDVQTALSILYSIQAAGSLADSYNLTVSFPTIYSLATNNLLTPQQIFTDFTSLLTFSATDQRAAALTALQNALASYQAGSNFIRNTRTGSTGYDHLFNINSTNAAEETQFRQLLTVASQSLTSPTVFAGFGSIVGLPSDPTVFLGKVFTTTVPPRSLLASFNGKKLTPGTWPDPTLDGVLPSGTQIMLDDIAYHLKLIAGSAPGSRDLNGDGIPDILLQNGSYLGVWCPDANGNFKQWIGMQADFGAWVPVGSADFDGDGVPDILLKNGTSLGVWCQNADGSFKQWIGMQADFGAWVPVGFADFNGDGIRDILLKNGTSLGVWCQNADGSFKQWIGMQADFGAWVPVGSADFDGDGVPDILLKNGTSLGVWCPDATGSFKQWIGMQADFGAWVPVGFADFNGDGVPDILLKNGTSIGVWCPDATGSFNKWVGMQADFGAWVPVGN